MITLNENFNNLKQNYLFIEIAKRISAYTAAHPEVTNPDSAGKLIRMGIGDVTRPLAPSVVRAFSAAALEMGEAATFRGYEDSGRGYGFLREAVCSYYKERGTDISPDEVFISDGAKSDSGNIGDIFSADNTVLLTDPVYPVYADTNIMAGRRIVYLNANESNGFSALPDSGIKADIIYLCSPNNPTGSVYTSTELKQWVDYARENKAVIIFDAAYEAFVTDNDLPRSIFEIDGARECAIEICSLSKTAGFTGTRCGYTVIPDELLIRDNAGIERQVKALWSRRQGSKFNGVSYPVQRAAKAVFLPENRAEITSVINYYHNNAKIITSAFDTLGITYTGGKNSPYVWFKCPGGLTSWEFFDKLMSEAGVVGTPGAGFGKNGENWFRLTAFNTPENTAEAIRRFREIL
ncbi:LL-diaminopimelate aminotransferase [Clostridia bacterium]|nr:LL-diaminopimelate aminotransferase [Clostridia bacterium]